MLVTQSMPEFSLWHRPTPPPGSRIKPEGVENYKKNRGTIESVAFEQVSGSSATFTPRPSPRCPSSAAKVNYKLGVQGNVGRVLNGTDTPRPSTAPPPRVKPEAQEIATISQGTRIRPIIHERSTDGPTPRQARVKPEGEGIATVSRGKRMKTIIHEFAQHRPSPRQPRVKAEAEGIAEVAKGGRMHTLLHKYGTMPLSARAVPRVKPEAESNAALDMGKRMNNIVHRYGQNEETPRAPPRVKPEAEDNAQLDRGKRMATLVHSYTLPLSARRVPRVKSEAARSAELGQGFRMAKLLHESHALPETPRPASRTLGEQAQQNWRRGVVGTVGKCLKESGRKSFIFLPGQQSRRYCTPSTA